MPESLTVVAEQAVLCSRPQEAGTILKEDLDCQVGYRRSVKDEAAARRAGLPTTVAPATQAGTEFVSAVPLGNATLAKAAELQPPPDSKRVAAAACGTDPRTGTQYRYNPQTGQPCEGIQQERVVVRQTPRQGPPRQAEQPREPTPQEQAADRKSVV